MRALHACAEIFPLLKTGGLADVAGALPRALLAQGVDARVVVPGFEALLGGLDEAQTVAELKPPLAWHAGLGVRLLRGPLRGTGLTAYVIDAPALYRRPGGPYADIYQQPFGDNHLRFALLGWVAAMLSRGLDADWSAQLVHAHDWHAGLTPAYLRADARHHGHRPAPSIYTVHNLAYQGNFAAHYFHELSLPADFFGVAGVEFHGQLNFMKAGLFFADRITTVSPTYAREIQGSEQGLGFDGLLRARSADLRGILNGVDPTVWNPAADALVPHHYDARRLAGKARNRSALQKELGLAAQKDEPLLVLISRLTDQKGLPLVLEALPAWLAAGVQMALLGSGDAPLEQAFRDLAARHPQHLAVHIGYDESLAHRLVAGGDAILVPSRFEPCGLTQLYGLAYGTLPVVRRVGGLADTVSDTRLETLDSDATGFVFDDFHAGALDHAVTRARALWRRPAEWKRLQQRAMAQPHSWDQVAAEYVKLYREVLPSA